MLGSLHDLNARLYAFLDEHYHKTPHASLFGKTPAAVYDSCPRKPDAFDEARLRAALTVHERRRVRRDGTLSMDGEDWQTDLGFLAGRLVSVSRCMVDPTEPPWIEHEGRRFVLGPVDPVKNGHRRRSHDNPRSSPRLQSGLRPRPRRCSTARSADLRARAVTRRTRHER